MKIYDVESQEKMTVLTTIWIMEEKRVSMVLEVGTDQAQLTWELLTPSTTYADSVGLC
jgi:hypothetical protein